MGIKFLQNIDAERNKFEEAGFEVVDALPTTNLFVGRQVAYGNSTYRYNGIAWRKIAAIADRVYPYQCHVNFYSNAIEGAIIIRTPIAVQSDYNNSMTYIEVSVYSHIFGETVAKYLIYYYRNPPIPSRDKLRYSVIGSPAFERVRIAYDNNNNQCIVFGDFKKTYRCHVVLNVVATGFKRTSDDTDKFEIIQDADESNYTNLIEGYGIQFSYARGFKVPDGTATQMLMADGSTKDISGFASSEDIPTQLPNPNPIIIKTADGVSVRYDGSASGGVILEAGDNAELTATQDSDDTMTVRFGAVMPQTLPNPNALNITVLDSEGALLGPSMVYDGVAAKYFKLIEGYGIRLSNSNLSNSNSHEVTINLKQIAGTTLLGNANGTTDIPQAITMAQLRTMLGSLMINDISIMLGGNSSYTLPCYIDYADTRYLCRISSDATGLQIYRNGVWVTIGKFCQCNTRGTITNSNIDSWYEDTVSNYELDESLSAALFAEDLTTNFGTSMAGAWTGKTVTLNLTSVSIKDTKSAWEMLKKNMGDCFPRDSVENIRYYYNVAIPSGEVVTKVELSYHNGLGMCMVHFYTEG